MIGGTIFVNKKKKMEKLKRIVHSLIAESDWRP